MNLPAASSGFLTIQTPLIPSRVSFRMDNHAPVDAGSEVAFRQSSQRFGIVSRQGRQ
jgi:hypothetical protein